jgi:hypothetical protein
VHYVSQGSPILPDGGQVYPSVCRAATVTEAGAWITDSVMPDSAGTTRTLTQHWQPDACALAVSNPTGQFFPTAIEHDEAGHAPGTWHWPERIPMKQPQEDR